MDQTKFTLFCCLLLPLKALAITWAPPVDVGVAESGIYASDIALNNSDNLLIVSENQLDTLVIQASSNLGTFQTISSIDVDNIEARVGISSAGTGVAVWNRFGVNQVARASSFSGIAWGDPITISVIGNDVSHIYLSMNDSGNAIAVWEQFDGGSNQVIKAAHYTSGTWGSPVTISSILQHSGLPKIAINNNGDAIAVWLASTNGSVNVVQSATFTLGAWSPSQTLSLSAADSSLPNVAMNLSGDGVAVWQYFDGLYNVIQSANYISGTWSAPQTLSLSTSNADIPQVAMNDSGNAVAAWLQTDGNNTSIQAATYFAAAWDAFETISIVGQKVTNPKIAMNNSNDAIVLFQSRQTQGYFAQVNFFTSGAWETPQNISGASLKFINPLLGFNNLGHAYAVWTHYDGTLFTVQSSFGS